MEEYVVEVVNLTQGKLYYLSKPLFDRAAACVYGQDYARDHRQENKDLIYFRVVEKSTVKSFTPVNFNIEWYDGEECSCSPIEEIPCPEELTCGVDCDRCPDAWECDDAFYMDRKSSVANKTDPYKNCLLTQEMLNEINRHFNSAYPVQLNHD